VLVLIRLSLLLIVVPLVELVLLLTLKDVMGFEATLAVVIATGLGGAWLLRMQGLRTFRRIGEELGAGRLPSTELLDGVLLMFAGILLLTPGVLTDLVGIALLIPLSRSVFRSWLIEYFKRRWQLVRFPGPNPTSTTSTPRSSEVIDSYVVPPKKEVEPH
jgi:UPF0716 protein FxsA